MLVMLNTLMDISEAESGAMPLQREPVMLAEVVGRAIDLYRDVAEAKGVTLTSATDPTVVVSGDRVRLEQVAANLIDNAIKYTPRGGAVNVHVARLATVDAQYCACATPGSAFRPTNCRASGSGCFAATRAARSAARPRPEPGQGDRRGPRRHRFASRASPAAAARLLLRCPYSPIAPEPLRSPEGPRSCSPYVILP